MKKYVIKHFYLNFMYFLSRLFETQWEGMGSHSLKLCGNNPQDDTYI